MSVLLHESFYMWRIQDQNVAASFRPNLRFLRILIGSMLDGNGFPILSFDPGPFVQRFEVRQCLKVRKVESFGRSVQLVVHWPSMFWIIYSLRSVWEMDGESWRHVSSDEPSVSESRFPAGKDWHRANQVPLMHEKMQLDQCRSPDVVAARAGAKVIGQGTGEKRRDGGESETQKAIKRAVPKREKWKRRKQKAKLQSSRQASRSIVSDRDTEVLQKHSAKLRLEGTRESQNSSEDDSSESCRPNFPRKSFCGHVGSAIILPTTTSTIQRNSAIQTLIAISFIKYKSSLLKTEDICFSFMFFVLFSILNFENFIFKKQQKKLNFFLLFSVILISF